MSSELETRELTSTETHFSVQTSSTDSVLHLDRIVAECHLIKSRYLRWKGEVAMRDDEYSRSQFRLTPSERIYCTHFPPQTYLAIQRKNDSTHLDNNTSKTVLPAKNNPDCQKGEPNHGILTSRT